MMMMTVTINATAHAEGLIIKSSLASPDLPKVI